ncbi:MAG TPA: RNA polymerase sigma factor, partial [Solirubrobacter sp.]|nr:RNA polymerase sigma factor [Solirubrobacter sp.]
MDDSRLAARVRDGDEAAFAELYDRHHRALLSFCRHMLGNVQDGEDAVQQTFIRAHRALAAGTVPDAVRPWLFAIARNRCKTMLAARRPDVPVEDVELSLEGMSDDVARRADLRELLADLSRLPEDQRAALVLFELGGMSQADIATAIGIPSGKVKALVYQARTELMAERDARLASCESIRQELAVARGAALRRGPLRRHLRQCEPCASFRAAVAAQRTGLASILPVAPAVGLKAAILAAATAGGHGGAAAGGAIAGGADAAGHGLDAAAQAALTAKGGGSAASGGTAASGGAAAGTGAASGAASGGAAAG